MSAVAHVPEAVVVCPKCSHPFPLSKALAAPIEANVTGRLEAKYAEREQAQREELQRRFTAASAKTAEAAKAAVAAELAALNQQVAEQAVAITKHQTEELNLRKRAREVEAREKALAVEVERKVDERSKQVEEETATRLREVHRLKDLEKDKQLADLKRQLEDAIRRAQQGSQQLQGEVAELDLEAQLRKAFPGDQVECFSPGQHGGDILLKVVGPRGEVEGTILFEMKNTKAFSEVWIPKLREDQRTKGADLGVIVTVTLPKDITTFSNRGGAWVTGLSTWLPLAVALRSGLLEVARARVLSDNRQEKQASLFAYVGGIEFRQRIEAMLDPVLAMMDDFQKERRALLASWSRREKRYLQIVQGIACLYGDVGGIIGTLPRLSRLELLGDGGGPEEPGGKAA